MTTTVVMTNGQIVIPSRIRRHLSIKKGTRLCVIEKDNKIVLQLLTREYFEQTTGVMKTNGKLTQALLDERKKDKASEEEKWSKS